MLKAKQIPDEARAAAKKAYFNSPHLSWQDAIDVALVAMLAAWPGAFPHTFRGPLEGYGYVLPLPTQENGDD